VRVFELPEAEFGVGLGAVGGDDVGHRPVAVGEQDPLAEQARLRGPPSVPAPLINRSAGSCRIPSRARTRRALPGRGADMAAQQHGGGAQLDGRAATARAPAGPELAAGGGAARCILPRCANTAAEQGLPCDTCLQEFGTHLRAAGGPPMTAEAQAARDRETRHSYALQLAAGDQALVAVVGARCARQGGAADPLERKANQRCWLCEERHICIKAGFVPNSVHAFALPIRIDCVDLVDFTSTSRTTLFHTTIQSTDRLLPSGS
jgi:hypothetical protein